MHIIAAVTAAAQTNITVVEAISQPRMAAYQAHCGGDRDHALELYAWNAQVSAAFWETLGYLEVILRNALVTQLQQRHHLKRNPGHSWLDDLRRELDQRARDDIATARGRVHTKGKAPSDGQTIAELGFGFWRYLLASRYATTLWPDLASAFPNAPSRSRTTIEAPVKALHVFRNRLAHHEPVWNKHLVARQHDIHTVLDAIDPVLKAWVTKNCRISAVLQGCTFTRPHP